MIAILQRVLQIFHQLIGNMTNYEKYNLLRGRNFNFYHIPIIGQKL